MKRWFRGFGPVIAPAHGAEVLRAATGACLGLLVAAGVLYEGSGAALIAPLGASAVLVFAAPNSPLAQPWSVIVGNTLAAALALALVAVLPPGPWVAPVVAALAIAAMVLARALHPPGGAVALVVALSGPLPPVFALWPVAAGSAVLVAAAMLWNRATGRVYPFRQPGITGPHGTADPTPGQRVGLDPAELSAILEDYNQSANLGVADLARLIGAAERAAAARRMEAFTCADIMSRDLVTVPPDAPVSVVADLFRARAFTSLPVVDGAGRFLGVIFQLDLIRRAREDALRLDRGFLAAFARLIDRSRNAPPVAGDIMRVAVPRATPATPVGAVLRLLSEDGAEAVPVVVGPAIVGIVTRSDLVSALALRLGSRPE